MKTLNVSFLLLVLCIITNSSCVEDNEELVEIEFEKENWQIKVGNDYVYRKQMLKSVLYNDSLRTLKKNEIIALLNMPDKEVDNHLYYMIEQQRLGLWPLHTRTLVVKINDKEDVEWIKLHE